MKWFKHISDSLDDPFIFDLCQECGPSGYYVFFGVLEMYAREFKVQDGFKLVLSLHYLCTKLAASRKQLIIKAIKFCSDNGKWDVKFEGKYVEIYIPKFKKYLDEFTLKKLREAEKKSGSTPERVRIESEFTPSNVRTEVDVDVDKEKQYIGSSVPYPEKKITPIKSYPYPEWLNKELWTDFHRMRSRIKKPITSERTITALLNKLKSIIDEGHNQDDVIQASITGCWITFYQPKGTTQKQKEGVFTI